MSRATDIEVLQAIAAAGEQGAVQTRDLSALDAFEDMLIRLEEGRIYELTPKQRRWLDEVAARAGIDERCGDSDEDQDPEPVRFTGGSIPRGREVDLNVGPKVTRPPGRR